jgi:hypothetical protein
VQDFCDYKMKYFARILRASIFLSPTILQTLRCKFHFFISKVQIPHSKSGIQRFLLSSHLIRSSKCHSPGHRLRTNSPVLFQNGFFPSAPLLNIESCSAHFINASMSSATPGPEQENFRSLRWNSETSLQPQV